MNTETYDVVVIGGGPAGATAANDLAKAGRKVLLLERGGRIKPCGGAIPPQALKEFDLPEEVLVAKARAARMIAPSGRAVDMPIPIGFVGLVDRKDFDEWLRQRAAASGAVLKQGNYLKLSRDADGTAIVHYRETAAATAAEGDVAGSDGLNPSEVAGGQAGVERQVRARAIIGADGANSQVAKHCVPGADKMRYVFAYHEIVRTPEGVDGERCDVYYQGRVSPDFYGWVFPHGDTMSIGVGSEIKGFPLRRATADLRKIAGLGETETLRCEGAPLPLKPLAKWDNGRDVVLAGDAAGCVAPASGEGIYYALAGGRFAAEAVEALLATGKATSLGIARRKFMKAHGRVFWALGLLQRFWYTSDARREKFVKLCADPDIQDLTWESYLHKRLVRKKPFAHVRVFLKDVAHLLGLAKA
ncbi:geranylgeranyl reductase family protein [Rhodocyclus purpureus]|uniref:geranylgeranyl reductase family protein n=1 Tax=Rhodocyclus purpureus TaxID=1067 RepID=UPI0019112DC4|nr:geranylgeranyl reductase family protein [Rhodocyclus purpureus]MBK5913705.1 geranylgeranyl diphosphate reductase [Rhodocyclus purpureus]